MLPGRGADCVHCRLNALSIAAHRSTARPGPQVNRTPYRTRLPAAAAALAVTLAVTGALLLSILLAWRALSAVDFLYPWLYDALSIDQHIQEFGPQNRYRKGFETLSPERHKALFGAIVESINQGGEGLSALQYQPPGASRPIPLLRPPEVEHLELVARLVQGVHRAGYAGAGLLAAGVGLLAGLGRVLPRRAAFLGLGVCAALAGGLALASFDVGDGGLFAWLHEQVFPPGHQWFFYYQESLMTTLMKAPHLFGPVALALAALTLACFLALLAGARRLTEWRRER